MSVGIGPFLVVDDARRQCLQLEVGHAVRADDHGAAFPAELVDNGLESRRTAVQVVAVELHGKASAERVMHTQVPASADAQIVTFGNEMNHFFVPGILVNALRGTVGRMVVDDNQVEREVCFLFQYRFNGVGNGADAVAHGDYDRSLVCKFTFRQIDFALHRGQEGMDIFQVISKCRFPFQLYAPVARVYVVKLFFARQAGVFFDFGVKELTYVRQFVFL